MRKQPDDCALPMDFTSLVQVKSHRAQRVFEAARHLLRKAAVTLRISVGGYQSGQTCFRLMVSVPVQSKPSRPTEIGYA